MLVTVIWWRVSMGSFVTVVQLTELSVGVVSSLYPPAEVGQCNRTLGNKGSTARIGGGQGRPLTLNVNGCVPEFWLTSLTTTTNVAPAGIVAEKVVMPLAVPLPASPRKLLLIVVGS